MSLINVNGAGKSKISKGYRLRLSTHRKIKALQESLNCSQDAVISRALRYYTRKLNGK